MFHASTHEEVSVLISDPPRESKWLWWLYVNLIEQSSSTVDEVFEEEGGDDSSLPSTGMSTKASSSLTKFAASTLLSFLPSPFNPSSQDDSSSGSTYIGEKDRERFERWSKDHSLTDDDLESYALLLLFTLLLAIAGYMYIVNRIL